MRARIATLTTTTRNTLFAAAATLAAVLTATPASAGSMGETKADIVDAAISAGSFETLVTAVDAAGLVETLKGPGPFTVFAPTDEAFRKVPQATLEALLADKAALTEVLTYHVVPGKVMAADVAGMSMAATVQGESIDIDATDGVTVDGARVIHTDIETSNGVIHVIDTVILPDAVVERLSAAPGRMERSIALWEHWAHQRSYGR